MDWEIEVDVLCAGGGIGAMATAIVSVDAGCITYVAGATGGNYRGDGVASPRRLLGGDIADEDTNRYFNALTEDLLERRAGPRPFAGPIGVIEDLSPIVRTPRRVAPFVGSRLRDWAAGCITSPSGFLYTRVPEYGGVNMCSTLGESFEVTAIGTADPGPDLVVSDWLAAQARRRGIDVCSESRLKRIVFEDGHVLGAVLETPTGPRAVRTRKGVLLSTGDSDAEAATPCAVPEGATLHVSIVRQAPSRFGRIALLTSEPLSQTPHRECRMSDRHLLATARETRQSRSPHLRCGELHWYPPLGK